MQRQIIKIDVDKCNGCGACVTACHEGAIGLKNGKAHLLREDYCDGLGDCLPACPTEAISFIQAEALPYDPAAVLANHEQPAKPLEKPASTEAEEPRCPSAATKSLRDASDLPVDLATGTACRPSRLANWPVQIKLANPKAGYFNDSELLIAADCCAYACADFHERFMAGRVTLIGCPKLDEGDYAEKLALILQNDITGVTVVRMEVPCCRGLVLSTEIALRKAQKSLRLKNVVISTEGEVL